MTKKITLHWSNSNKGIYRSASFVRNVFRQAVLNFWRLEQSRLLQTKDTKDGRMQLMLNQSELMVNFYNNSMREIARTMWEGIVILQGQQLLFLFTSTPYRYNMSDVRCKQSSSFVLFYSYQVAVSIQSLKERRVLFSGFTGMH